MNVAECNMSGWMRFWNRRVRRKCLGQVFTFLLQYGFAAFFFAVMIFAAMGGDRRMGILAHNPDLGIAAFLLAYWMYIPLLPLPIMLGYAIYYARTSPSSHRLAEVGTEYDEAGYESALSQFSGKDTVQTDVPFWAVFVVACLCGGGGALVRGYRWMTMRIALSSAATQAGDKILHQLLRLRTEENSGIWARLADFPESMEFLEELVASRAFRRRVNPAGELEFAFSGAFGSYLFELERVREDAR